MSVKIYLIVSLMRFEITMEAELWVCVWGASWIGVIEVGRPSLRLSVHGTSRWTGVRDEQKGIATEHQHLSPLPNYRNSGSHCLFVFLPWWLIFLLKS